MRCVRDASEQQMRAAIEPPYKGQQVRSKRGASAMQQVQSQYQVQQAKCYVLSFCKFWNKLRLSALVLICTLLDKLAPPLLDKATLKMVKRVGGECHCLTIEALLLSFLEAAVT